MKIASIDIQEFRQFKNLKLDLTYPKGHKKAGEPLDKVCIIGQSGTGKTSLLELMFRRTIFANSFDYTILEEYKKNQFDFRTNSGESLSVKIDSDSFDKIIKFNKPYFYFIAPLIKAFKVNVKSHIATWKGEANNLWYKNKTTYEEHANERSKYIFAVSNFINKLSSTEDFIKNKEVINHLKIEKDNWEKENPNPLEDIATFLDPIINKFSLKTRVDITSLRQLAFIPIMDKDENDVPESKWSTGTKQVIHKTYPLFALKPENAIILIDEPENSLYPDIQTEIIEHYTRLAPTSQFFFATHSPIIASCFEPWEIVELKFNEEGEVYRELYYEGDNHVDNYFVDPRYLTWDSILRKVFDLKRDGNPQRNKQLTELSKIDNQLQNLKQNGKSVENVEQIKVLIEKYNALAEKLDWEIK